MIGPLGQAGTALGPESRIMAKTLLDMRGISKVYPGVQALQFVDFTLDGGEVLALVGENGAGKSTLIKILGGAVRPDAGTISLNGSPVHLTSPDAARRAGISVIYQEFNLIPRLTVSENVFLGRERRGRFLPLRDERRRTRELLKRMGMSIDPDATCDTLSVAQQQGVEIAKALVDEARIVVMDEPSATLSPQEVAGLFKIVRELTARGIAIVYVSHRLGEIFEIADRITVLRDGRHVGTGSVRAFRRDSLIELMVGRRLQQEFPPRTPQIGEVRLSVSNLNGGPRVRDVSFSVRHGEVVALTGLVGAGRTETARAIFGADRPRSGTIDLDGRRLKIRHPRDAIRAGICLLTEDRKAQGLILGQSVLDNFGLPSMRRFAPRIWLDRGRERSEFNRYVEQIRIKISGPSQPAGTLSGGNQQKVVLAKWLATHSEVIIFDEPTRGIDVGAKYEIYQLINDLAVAGKAIVLISSELPEVLGMADRILVMHEGTITGEIADAAQATQEQIMDLAVR